MSIQPVILNIPGAALEALCTRYKVQRLAFFGSVLRQDFHAESDVDVLVEFLPNATIGWEIVSLEAELGALIGRRVDLRTAQALSRHFRHEVLENAQTFYEQA